MHHWVALATMTLASAGVTAVAPAAPPEPTKTEKADPKAQPVREVFEAHNRERVKAKLDALSLDPKLTAAAQAHATDMASHGKMTHDGSDGSTPSDRVKRQDYHFRNIGENVAEGYPSVEALMRGWMESPHHRENILGKFTQVGIAVARDDSGTPYWCADFGTPWEKLDPTRAGEDLVKALNKERTAAGLRPLAAQPKLTAVALQIAGEYASADTLDLKEGGKDLTAALKRLGYRYRRVGESAASGQPGVNDVVKSWMDNPSLREQILGDFTEVGVGYAASPTSKPYWCLVLARPLQD